MSLRTTMLVAAVALSPLTATAGGLQPEECEVIEAVEAGAVDECGVIVGDAGGIAGNTPEGGLALPGLDALGVTNFGPALLPLALGGAAVAAALLAGDDDNNASNGTN